MNNDFYNGANRNQNDNRESTYSSNSYQDYNNSNGFLDNNYPPYSNDDNSFGNSFNNGDYNSYTKNDSYAESQHNENTSYGGYGQNQSTSNNYPNNQYGGYNQYENYSNNQNGYNNPNQNNGYNQNQNYADNRYAGNNSYQDNRYAGNNNYQDNRYVGNNSYSNNRNGNNYNNQRGYNNYNPAVNQQAFMDSNDPIGAEVVYAKEKSNSKLGWIILALFFIPFILVPITNFLPGDSASMIMAGVFPIIFLGLFLFIILYAMLEPIVTAKKKKRTCTHLVTAKIVDVRVTRSSKGHRHYYPTYKYYYGGKIYIVSASSSRGVMHPMVGQEVQMLINTDNPVDFFIESKGSIAVALIFGGFFLIMLLGMLMPMILGLFFNRM